jgi:hypothetical protein
MRRVRGGDHEEIGGEVLVLLGATMWRKITGIPELPGILLDEAERGGAPAVRAATTRYGVTSSTRRTRLTTSGAYP